MARIKNIGPCPVAVERFIQSRLAEAKRRYGQRSWLRRQLFHRFERPGQYVADVRWLSECDLTLRTCSGYLLGRWDMHAQGSRPCEVDFAPEPSDAELDQGIVDPLVDMVYDFALSPEQDRCVIVEIDLDGRVERAAYELPGGIHSEEVGVVIGNVIREKFKRDRWDPCVPPGWRPRPPSSPGGESPDKH